MIRLQKYLAECGVASRRKSEELIVSGTVTVNGSVVTKLGTSIDEGKDFVKVEGKLIRPSAVKVYIMLHKPIGYITSTKDELGRPTVLELVKKTKAKLVPVGRLDCNTSGLLLLSNDGNFVYQMTHPKNHISKIYEVKVKGVPTQDEIERLKKSIVIDGKPTKEADARIKKILEKNCIIEVRIFEGRNRQVRKMFERIPYPILHLKRTAIGKLKLSDLAEGEYRHLTPSEIRNLSE